ncbi:MAG: AraC family transcriptional regulator [Eubacteriales bacterium]
MKWIKRLTKCADYIEENLKDEIKVEELAKISCLSTLYFPRLFEAITDISLSEYIRRRRMTLAAKDIIDGNSKIIDIALDYGYSSPESFSRAFKSVHGISPSNLKRETPTIKSYPKLAFSISIKGDVEMNYKIIEKDAFQVLGRSIITDDIDQKNLTEIPLFWQKINADGTSEKIMEHSAADTCAMFGICFDAKEDRSFKYAAAVPYDGGETGGFEVMDIPSAKWAVFECIGPMPNSIQIVWKRIFSEWLPATEYELVNQPQIEYYYPGDPSGENYRSEVWIPIK